MNVTLKALTLDMIYFLRSPEARYAQPEANSPLCCRSSCGLIWTRDGNKWCPRIYCPRGCGPDARRRQMMPNDVLSSGLQSGQIDVLPGRSR